MVLLSCVLIFPATHSLSIDFHTHSTFSDGVLTPQALVRRAASRGVTLLSLTDHDETGGLTEAVQTASELNIRLIPGVEISVDWDGHTLHVLGLDIDPQAPALAQGLVSSRRERGERALRIATQLDAAGVTGSLPGATRHAGASAAIGRNHFARFLVEHKHVRNTNEAFSRYLGAGRCAYVPTCWPNLAQAISWIHDAGGHAVLAHPDRYRLAPRIRQSLFEVFASRGGDAIEVSGDGRFKSSAQVRLALQFGFAVSSGSDFHAPGHGVPDIGEAIPLPSGVPALWERVRAVQ